jgi:ribulose 1,5-bisphosphate synthetase/thiazole synthase
MDQAHVQDLAAISARVEHLDVIIVGAGLSGIDAAYRLQTAARSVVSSTTCTGVVMRPSRRPRVTRR